VGRLGTMQTATDAVTEAPTAKTPGSGVELTFRLNVVAQTPRQREEGLSSRQGEKRRVTLS
jgi:hypothetical protein